MPNGTHSQDAETHYTPQLYGEHGETSGSACQALTKWMLLGPSLGYAALLDIKESSDTYRQLPVPIECTELESAYQRNPVILADNLTVAGLVAFRYTQPPVNASGHVVNHSQRYRGALAEILKKTAHFSRYTAAYAILFRNLEKQFPETTKREQVVRDKLLYFANYLGNQTTDTLIFGEKDSTVVPSLEVSEQLRLIFEKLFVNIVARKRKIEIERMHDSGQSTHRNTYHGLEGFYSALLEQLCDPKCLRTICDTFSIDAGTSGLRFTILGSLIKKARDLGLRDAEDISLQPL